MIFFFFFFFLNIKDFFPLKQLEECVSNRLEGTWFPTFLIGSCLGLLMSCLHFFLFSKVCSARENEPRCAESLSFL